MEVTYNIKGMVCDRCISAVQQALFAIGHQVTRIYLGEVSIKTEGVQPDISTIESALSSLGLSILEDKQAKIIKQVKDVIASVYSGDFDFPYIFRLSALLQEQLRKDYDAISAMFSAAEGITLESYAINYRMNKVKEFLEHTDSTLSDIAFRLGFNSAAHLSKQFKDMTGLTTGHYKLIKQKKVYA